MIYKDLQVWQVAMNLVTDVYRVTQTFPKEELYALTNQIRRAIVSVPSNIAEGHQRNSTKQFLQFLSIARGSLAEAETQLLIAERLLYISQETMITIQKQITSTGNLLGALIKALEKKEEGR